MATTAGISSSFDIVVVGDFTAGTRTITAPRAFTIVEISAATTNGPDTVTITNAGAAVITTIATTALGITPITNGAVLNGSAILITASANTTTKVILSCIATGAPALTVA